MVLAILLMGNGQWGWGTPLAVVAGATISSAFCLSVLTLHLHVYPG